jgi:hypothetical protein
MDGDYDRGQFERQCQSSQRVGDGLKLIRLPLRGTHHRVEDDAWNIAGMNIVEVFACPQTP